MTPLISVIVVTYESGQEISRCLAALKGNSSPVELIVVDNASRDDTWARVNAASRDFPGCQLIRNEENVGFSRAVNIGLRTATGTFVLVLNPDCYVAPRTISDVASVLNSEPSAGMAGCLLLNPDGTEQAGCRRYIPTPWRALVRVLRLHRFSKFHPRLNGFLMNQEPLPSSPTQVEAISGAFMLIRRTALDEVGFFDESYFMHCEDLDLCTRFRQRGWPILFVPTAAAIHDKGRSSNSRPLRVEWYKHRGMIRFYSKFLRGRYPGFLMWLVVLAVGARFSLVAAREFYRKVRHSAATQKEFAIGSPVRTSRDIHGPTAASSIARSGSEKSVNH